MERGDMVWEAWGVEARVKVGRINIVRPGKKEKEVLREANGLYITRTTYHTVWYV